jgi:hypothetical protein
MDLGDKADIYIQLVVEWWWWWCNLQATKSNDVNPNLNWHFDDEKTRGRKRKKLLYRYVHSLLLEKYEILPYVWVFFHYTYMYNICTNYTTFFTNRQKSVACRPREMRSYLWRCQQPLLPIPFSFTSIHTYVYLYV